MSWFSRLLGRPQRDDIYDQPNDFALPAAPGAEPRYEGDLPAFRPSQGRVFVHGAHVDVDHVRASIREASALRNRSATGQCLRGGVNCCAT